MRLVLQRVKEATLFVRDTKSNNIEPHSNIGCGLFILAGFGEEDILESRFEASRQKLVNKVAKLRIFPDEEGKMNLSLKEYGGELLVVSQFTLYADCRRGARPGFSEAARPEKAIPLYERLLSDFEALFPGRVTGGVFGADMEILLRAWGPVTITLDSSSWVT